MGRLTRVKALPELSTTNEALSAAVDLTHRTLGRLRREPRATEFEGELRVLGTPVMLWVAQKEGLSVEQTLARAAALLVKVKKQFRQMPDAIVKKLLPLANGSWLEEGHAPSTRASLLRVLKPTTITFDQAARRAHVSFNCADVFGDHGVALTLTGSAIRDVRLQ